MSSIFARAGDVARDHADLVMSGMGDPSAAIQNLLAQIEMVAPRAASRS